MIDRIYIENDFIFRLGWKKICGLQGNFSVSPDSGSEIIRVFSSDIKINNEGRSLLGVIGIFSGESDYPFGNKLALSAYITNFEDFFIVPVLKSPEDVSSWTDKISMAINSMPTNKEDLLKDILKYKIGKFESSIFFESTPWYKDSIKWISS